MSTLQNEGAKSPAHDVHRVGQHTATIDGDTAFVDFVGDESAEEATRIADILAGYLAVHQRFYVICDVRRIGDVPGATRKAWLGWFKAHSPEAIILIQPGITVRTIAKLIMAATRVLTGREPRFVVVSSEDEGRAWLRDYKLRAS
jgi:hypothetical protein